MAVVQFFFLLLNDTVYSNFKSLFGFCFVLKTSTFENSFHFTTASTELTSRTKMNFLNGYEFRLTFEQKYFSFLIYDIGNVLLDWRYYAYWIPNQQKFQNDGLWIPKYDFKTLFICSVDVCALNLRRFEKKILLWLILKTSMLHIYLSNQITFNCGIWTMCVMYVYCKCVCVLLMVTLKTHHYK